MDVLKIADRSFQSRLILGSARYPNPGTMIEALKESGTEMVTVAIRRVSLTDSSGESLLELLRREGFSILPTPRDASPPRKRSSPPSSPARRSAPTGSSSK